MLSIIVYGRNDQHGYNMHKRVAISLNAMAETLCRDEDEIVFVDYASPWPAPTVPEVIADTLTDACRRRLRVIRVPASVHEGEVGAMTHLAVSEPLARNIGIRRAASTSDWILNTNTDMILVPAKGGSLLPGIADLDGDFFGTPRFEIPEWLWERLNRLDPAATISLLRDYGPRMSLDQAAIGHPWILFDAPGDFQLVRKHAINQVAGFDERMIHGWHVDSNLSRRLALAGFPVRSLRGEVLGYHTNHDRVPTLVASEQRRGNDLHRFFYGLTDSVPEGQEATWGLPDAVFEEIRLDEASLRVFIDRATLHSSCGQGAPSDLATLDDWNRISYDVRHVLPFVMDSVLGSGSCPVVGYCGIGSAMRTALAELTDALGGQLCGLDSVSVSEIDLAVIDLGLGAHPGQESGADREQLTGLLEDAEAAVGLLCEQRADCPIVIINGQSGIWRTWVASRFVAAPGTLLSRVQAARTVESGEITEAERDRISSALAWLARDSDIAAEGRQDAIGVRYFGPPLVDFSGFGDGWDLYDGHGVSMNEERATYAVRVPSDMPRPLLLAVQLRRIDYGDDASVGPVTVQIDIGGTLVGTCRFPAGSTAQLVSFPLPSGVSAGERVDCSFSVRRADGLTYRPRFESDVSGRHATWVRLESLAIVAQALPTGGGLVVDVSGSDCMPSVPVEGWAGISGGLVFGAERGSIRLSGDLARPSSVMIEVGYVGPEDTFAPGHVVVAAGGASVEAPLTSARRHERIVFETNPDSAGSLDLSVDLRSSGDTDRFRPDHWRLTRVEIARMPAELPHGRPVGPGSEAVSLVRGWSRVEPDGVWTIASGAVLRVRLPSDPDARGAVALTLETFPGKKVIPTITVGGCVLRGRQRVRGTFTALVMRTDLPDGSDLRLEVSVPNLSSPIHELGTVDDRELGIFLKSVAYREPQPGDLLLTGKGSRNRRSFRKLLKRV